MAPSTITKQQHPATERLEPEHGQEADPGQTAKDQLRAPGAFESTAGGSSCSWEDPAALAAQEHPANPPLPSTSELGTDRASSSWEDAPDTEQSCAYVDAAGQTLQTGIA